MPRPSLKAERTEEILDAVERCVIRDGINGATLEKIAEEAGMQRSLLRHNVGNREQLLDAFVDRFFLRSDQEVRELFDHLPREQPVSVLLDYLFDERYANSQLALVGLALTTAAASHGDIRKRLRTWNKDFIESMAQELGKAFPGAGKAACFEVAAGVVGIYFNTESLTPLGRVADIRTASKKAAARLLSTLEPGKRRKPPRKE